MKFNRGGIFAVAVGTLAIAFGACSNDPIVYPNRNLRAATAGDASESGAAGETGPDGGGVAQGGSNAGSSGGGGRSGKGGNGGNGGRAGNAGGPMVGPECGDGKIEAPEECDDGNVVSGDGCSADCQASCEKCEREVCPLYDDPAETPQAPDSAYDSCYKATEKIKQGPATGYSRGEVCSQLVDCIHEEKCAEQRGGILRTSRCWCDKNWWGAVAPFSSCVIDADPANPTDPTKFIPGKCASLFQDAAEYPTKQDVVRNITSVDYALGRANRLINDCDTRICTEECVPEYFKAGAIATITVDIVAAPNPAGESALGDLVADSQRAVAGTDFAFVSPTFITHDTDSIDLLVAATPNRNADAPGRVLWSEAMAVGWGYRARQLTTGISGSDQATLSLYKITITGQKIYDALAQQFSSGSGGLLFVSGLTYSYSVDATNSSVATISEVRKASDNTLIDKSASYSVALNGFLVGSNSPISALVVAAPMELSGVVVSQLLGEYLKQLPQPVSPPELNRIKQLN
jgi:cysteine-rich repeat protein